MNAVATLLKTCRTCKTERPFADFYVKDRGREEYVATSAGYDSRCKECTRTGAAEYRAANPEKHRNSWRRSNYMKKFGITIEDFDRMFAAQEGRCAICKTHQSEIPKTLAVDHDHDTGKVRGLLCIDCNHALGRFFDSVETMESAISYLKASSGKAG